MRSFLLNQCFFVFHSTINFNTVKNVSQFSSNKKRGQTPLSFLLKYNHINTAIWHKLVYRLKQWFSGYSFEKP